MLIYFVKKSSDVISIFKKSVTLQRKQFKQLLYMKKTLFLLLAVLAIVGCTNDTLTEKCIKNTVWERKIIEGYNDIIGVPQTQTLIQTITFSKDNRFTLQSDYRDSGRTEESENYTENGTYSVNSKQDEVLLIFESSENMEEGDLIVFKHFDGKLVSEEYGMTFKKK